MNQLILTNSFENGFMLCLIGISIGTIIWEIFRRKPYITNVRKNVPY